MAISRILGGTLLLRLENCTAPQSISPSQSCFLTSKTQNVTSVDVVEPSRVAFPMGHRIVQLVSVSEKR